MASKDNKVSNHIPDDLAFSVLSKLPLKSIKRFACVCKSWMFSFQNPNFMNAIRKNFISKFHSFYDDTRLLLRKTLPSYGHQCEFYMLCGERFENQVKLDLPPSIQYKDKYIQMLGSSIGGYICLYHEIKHDQIVLWKPIAKEFKRIPSSEVYHLPYIRWCTILRGFGYDSVNDDYKLIRYVQLINSKADRRSEIVEDVWEIYSLKNNSWKKLNIDMPCHYNKSVVVCMNGMCHWWGITDEEEYVVSFDLSNKVFFRTLAPMDMCDGSNLNRIKRHLLVLNMYISLISNYANDTTFHISILVKLGVRESWTKLFIVGPLFCVEYPIGIGGNGNIFFRKQNNELAYFDLSTGIIKEIGIQGESHSCQTVNYKS